MVKKTRALFHHILYCKQVHTDYTKHVDNSYVQNHLRRKTQKLDYIHNIFVYAAVHFNFISGLEYCLVLNNFKLYGNTFNKRNNQHSHCD